MPSVCSPRQSSVRKRPGHSGKREERVQLQSKSNGPAAAARVNPGSFGYAIFAMADAAACQSERGTMPRREWVRDAMTGTSITAPVQGYLCCIIINFNIVPSKVLFSKYIDYRLVPKSVRVHLQVLMGPLCHQFDF